MIYFVYYVVMYIESVPNRNSKPAILLRESYREGNKVLKRTLANLTKWPKPLVDNLKILVKNKDAVVADKSNFIVEQSLPHGHVEAVLGAIRKLKLDKIISATPCRELNLVLAMIAERLIHPCSKLATTRLWHTTTLATELAVADADVDELYDAMDWLLARQPRIEKKLAANHLAENSLVLYDISSSYYEGRTCSLAQFGHNRDDKKGRLIIVYGVLTDGDGRPISINVYPGNTADPATVADQVDKVRNRFKLSQIVLVGDRGMLPQTQIDKLKDYPGIGWISALKSCAIKKLVEQQHLQLSLFDQQNIAEIESPDYPDERLIACYNPFLAEERKHKRFALLAATENQLTKIVKQIERRTKTPLTESEIGIKVGKILNKYKMAKHFDIVIKDNFLKWARNEENITNEQMLDGIYVIRTSESSQRISAEDTVRSYKNLSLVERVFRCLKGIDVLIRPIRHRTEDHVRAHIFICMLAYYIEWHIRKALAPLLFHDEELELNKKISNPVTPAKTSPSAKAKKITKRTVDQLPVHSFETMMQELGTRCRNRCRFNFIEESPAFYTYTELNPVQKKAFQLLGLYP
jgi:transposase